MSWLPPFGIQRDEQVNDLHATDLVKTRLLEIARLPLATYTGTAIAAGASSAGQVITATTVSAATPIAVINSTAITTSSVVLLTAQQNGVTTPGANTSLYYSIPSAGTLNIYSLVTEANAFIVNWAIVA